MNANEFRELCLKHFSYLTEEFGCEVAFPEHEPPVPERLSGYQVLYANGTTRVMVTLEVNEKLPTVHVGRLNPGDNERKVWPLGLLLRVRAPELNPLKDETGPFPLKKDIETFLSEYAHALRVTASDILRGDFSVFPELEKEYLRQVELGRNRPDFTYY